MTLSRFKKEAPALDIIIVNYKSTDYLVHCLRSIDEAAKGLSVRVLVHDNHSKEDLDSLVVTFPRIELIKNDVNIGFARAINQTLTRSTAPYILILNPDTFILEGFFESVLSFMEKRPNVGVLGPTILNGDGSVQGSARSFPTLMTALFGRSTLLTKYFPRNPVTLANVLTARSDGVNPMDVDWVAGACMLIRREALNQVGPFDRRFFMYWEDADLCRRMWQKGWRVAYYPTAKIVHYVGGSSDRNVVRSVLEFHKSSYRLFNKHQKPSPGLLNLLVIQIIAVRILLLLGSNTMRRIGRKAITAPPLHARRARKTEKIKVLRIIARLNVGGPAIHVHLLTEGLDRDTFESTLLTGVISPQEGDMGYLFDGQNGKPVVIPELQREINPVMDIQALFRILGILKRERPDIVHTHTAKAGTIGRIAGILYNLTSGRRVKMVHTFHGSVFEGYFSRMKSRFFLVIETLLGKFTARIIAISESQKNDLSMKYRIAPPDKIRTVALGFDLDPFLRNRSLKGHFRKHLGVGDDTQLIGIVGRLVPIKNHRLFLDGARLFLDNHPHSEVLFVVVGDGELRHELERYCESRNLTHRVRFCGWIKDVASVYADLDVLALTSLNEGTPVSMIEAMASSVPAIAARVGGVIDLVGKPERDRSDGFMSCERGILFQKDDLQGFVKGLEYLVNGNHQDTRDRIERARRYIEQQYSSKRLFRDMASLYQELTGHPGSPIQTL